MHIVKVKIEKPEGVNFILGHTRLFKTVEDIHGVLASAGPGIKFGFAFCEASGKCLERWHGSDAVMMELAKKNALAIGAGHGFVIFFGEGFQPLDVLNAVNMAPEACSFFFPTANAAEVVIAASKRGRGILGVIDGMAPRGIGDPAEIGSQKGLLREIGRNLRVSSVNVSGAIQGDAFSRREWRTDSQSMKVPCRDMFQARAEPGKDSL
jgi:adenosine/AMP kinase